MSELTVRMLTYGVDSGPDFFGDVVVFQPGSLALPDADRVPFFRQHASREPASGVLEDAWTETDDQGDHAYARCTLGGTSTAADSDLELADGVRTQASVGVRILEFTEEETGDTDPIFGWPTLRMNVTAAELLEVSHVLRGRMPGARITDYRPDPAPQEAPQ